MKKIRVTIERYMELCGSGLSVEQMALVVSAPKTMDDAEAERLLANHFRYTAADPYNGKLGVEIIGKSRAGSVNGSISGDAVTCDEGRWIITQDF